MKAWRVFLKYNNQAGDLRETGYLVWADDRKGAFEQAAIVYPIVAPDMAHPKGNQIDIARAPHHDGQALPYEDPEDGA